MEIITTSKQLLKIIAETNANQKTIGFVPTMGALHDGHLSLIKTAKKKNDIVVCSVFVNPTQFNNKQDLKKYPRNLSKDSELLASVDCDYVFAPSVKVVYPTNLDTTVNLDLKGLDKVMEGEFRPGHFEGMMQVVKRLLDLVQPHDLYMGQKDFQQFTIVDFMIKNLKMKTNLIVCPIKREKNGLAMSSRNERLPSELREKAKLIFKTLKLALKNIDLKSIKEIETDAMNKLNVTDFKPEYFRIVDGYTLKPIKDYNKHKYVVACVACWVGEVRLIDNLIFKKLPV